MRYKAVIFDFDYTLGDSTEGIVVCMRYAMEQMGLREPSVSEIRPFIGLSLEETYRRLTGDGDPDNAKRFFDLFVRKADDALMETATFYDYSLPLVERLKRTGVKVCVFTTKYNRRIQAILDKYNVSGVMDIVVGADDVDAVKPDPEGLYKIAETFGLGLDEMIFVGDSLSDVKAASVVGVDFIGVLTGLTTEEQFEKYPHIAILPDLTTVEKYLD